MVVVVVAAAAIAGVVGAGVVLIALAAAPFWGGRDDLQLLSEIYAYVALASLWNLLAGYAGLVSVGQQAYVGLGAYASGDTRFGISRDRTRRMNDGAATSRFGGVPADELLPLAGRPACDLHSAGDVQPHP